VRPGPPEASHAYISPFPAAGVNVRAQLILAFLLLAVVPLAGIVFFSYLTSLDSFRRAVEVEARGLAEEMSARLDTVRQDLRGHLDSIARLPARPLLPSALEGGEAIEVYTDLMAQMGDLASLVDWLEFVPIPPDVSGAGTAIEVEPFFIYPSRTLAETLGRLGRGELGLEESGLTQEYLDAAVRQAILQSERLKAGELEALQARGEEARELLGSEFTSPVLRGNRLLGRLKALVPPSHILRQVLSRTPRDAGEVPYARDERGSIYVDRREDRKTLADIGVPAEESSATTAENWIVVETPDAESGLIFGVARPIRESLRDFRQTAVRNFAYGLGIMVLAMAGIVWLSARMTRNLSALNEGARRLASGDLTLAVLLASVLSEYEEIEEMLDGLREIDATHTIDDQVLVISQEQLSDPHRLHTALENLRTETERFEFLFAAAKNSLDRLDVFELQRFGENRAAWVAAVVDGNAEGGQ